MIWRSLLLRVKNIEKLYEHCSSSAGGRKTKKSVPAHHQIYRHRAFPPRPRWRTSPGGWGGDSSLLPLPPLVPLRAVAHGRALEGHVQPGEREEQHPGDEPPLLAEEARPGLRVEAEAAQRVLHGGLPHGVVADCGQALRGQHGVQLLHQHVRHHGAAQHAGAEGEDGALEGARGPERPRVHHHLEPRLQPLLLLDRQVAGQLVRPVLHLAQDGAALGGGGGGLVVQAVRLEHLLPAVGGLGQQAAQRVGQRQLREDLVGGHGEAVHQGQVHAVPDVLQVVHVHRAGEGVEGGHRALQLGGLGLQRLEVRGRLCGQLLGVLLGEAPTLQLLGNTLQLGFHFIDLAVLLLQKDLGLHEAGILFLQRLAGLLIRRAEVDEARPDGWPSCHSNGLKMQSKIAEVLSI
mmetsp:Transcript_23500/g.40995  ORF Transcript_23500/g.40995 Transcript_23500/m.40995 type:complete len:404 (+) Transcript_23500:240-1451(+)